MGRRKNWLRVADRYGIGLFVYIGVAIVSAVLEWFSFAACLLVMPPVPASLVGFAVATAGNYLLSRQLAFLSKRPALTELALTIVMSAIAFSVNFLVFYSLFYLGTQIMVAKVAGTGAGFVFNYLGRQFLIFSSEPRVAPVSAFLGGRSDQQYRGTRILEAMRSGVRYGQAIFQQIDFRLPSRELRILEGFFAEKFQGVGIKVDCVEPDPDLRQKLAANATAVYATTLELPSNAFDFIYAVNVLEHIHELEATCAELLRILVPGGKLFVFVPAFNVLWTSLDDEVGHIQRFRRGSLALALCSAGFVVDETRYFDSLGFPAAFGVRILERFGLFHYDGTTVGFYDRYLFPLSQKLDGLTSCLLGKNIIAVAHKPSLAPKRPGDLPVHAHSFG
jgi:putative flippase GtrA